MPKQNVFQRILIAVGKRFLRDFQNPTFLIQP